MENSFQFLEKSKTNEIFEDSIGNSIKDFYVMCELGRGTYGTVYKVKSLRNKNEYVMKKIGSSLKEAEIMKKLEHQNIIKYYSSFFDLDSFCIVMEYAPLGDLSTLIKTNKSKKKYFSEKEIWDFALQLCSALNYLHEKNIIHRDIKSLNIFLSQNKVLKIGDLGVSKIINQDELQISRVGTPLYLSPEQIKQQKYDNKVDVWALGCVLYQIACLEMPFIGENLISLGNSIVNSYPKRILHLYSEELNNFIMCFLEKNPQERPKIDNKNKTISNDNVTTHLKFNSEIQINTKKKIIDEKFLLEKKTNFEEISKNNTNIIKKLKSLDNSKNLFYTPKNTIKKLNSFQLQQKTEKSITEKELLDDNENSQKKNIMNPKKIINNNFFVLDFYTLNFIIKKINLF